MNQNKLGSLIESTVNTLIGFIVSFVSVLRGYAVRRFFNARLHSASLVIAGKISNEP